MIHKYCYKKSLDSFISKRKCEIMGSVYEYFSLKEAALNLSINLSSMPVTIRILFENLLRNEDDRFVSSEMIRGFVKKYSQSKNNQNKNSYIDLNDSIDSIDIELFPARVLMQDFTGVPAIVDLAAMRDAMNESGRKDLVGKINPIIPVDLVIDHSIAANFYGNADSLSENVDVEMKHNLERYMFIKWAQHSLKNFRAIPTEKGICHQINLEYLAPVVCIARGAEGENDSSDKNAILYPDIVIGTDSHTTMINGLSVLGWGVGGIEAESAMLGQSLSMQMPKVVGVHLKGKMPNYTTATDLVLLITSKLRKHGVVGKYVEFYGDALDMLSIADRATIANMAPEYGATCGFFPIDDITLQYLELTGRDDDHIKIIKEYSRIQSLNRESIDYTDIRYDEYIDIDLGDVKLSLAGPKRPQDLISLREVPENFKELLGASNIDATHIDSEIEVSNSGGNIEDDKEVIVDLGSLANDRIEQIKNAKKKKIAIKNGSIVIAAITSCTNTSNPFVMIGAGLIAKRAYELGLQTQPFVKTSLAVGSQVVTAYLERLGLDKYLEKFGFYNVGYGCTTCIGNSGALLPEIDAAINESDLTVVSVLSGNRNFEGRIHPLVKANYLASPMLCVIYAIVGNIICNLEDDPVGFRVDGSPVYLMDLWPSNDEINMAIKSACTKELYIEKYRNVEQGGERWNAILTEKSELYRWDLDSTYILSPPYFKDYFKIDCLRDVNNARILGIFGDSITTDHISPAGFISPASPAGKYLLSRGVSVDDFNSYGSRRGNHEVMVRGTFANNRIRNNMMHSAINGGSTIFFDESYDGIIDKGRYGESNGDSNGDTRRTVKIYDAAMAYGAEGRALVVFAGKEYGTGSSRDWAAKGPRLLGIRAVIAQSFERIHRSNLIGMGILPVQMPETIESIESLKLDGSEVVSLIIDKIEKQPKIICKISRENGIITEIICIGRIDTDFEIEYLKSGGILQYMFDSLCMER